MAGTLHFLKENAVWIVGLGAPLLAALGWAIRRILEGSGTPKQEQTVSGNATGIQAGRDVRIK
jgi:ABC-type transporter Mla subunit MlaD